MRSVRNSVVFLLLLQILFCSSAYCKTIALEFPEKEELGRLFYYWPVFQPGEYLAAAKGKVLIRSARPLENLALRLNPKAADIPSLEKIPSLRKIHGIDLSIVPMDDAKLKRLAALLNLFPAVNIPRSEITDVSIPLLAANKNLQFLNLSVTKVQGKNLALLGTTPITQLRIGSCMLDKKAFEQLGQLTKLTMLELNYSGFNWIQKPLSLSDQDWDVQLLPSLSKLSSLVELDNLALSGVPAGPQCLKVLSKFPKLKQLALSSTGIDVAGIDSIKTFPLETLLLARCPNVDDRCSKIIGGMKRLRWLELSYTKVSAEGLKNLADLRPDRLELVGLKLGKSDLAFLKGWTLNSLDLQNAGITDSAVPAISAIKTLHFLNLGNTRVTDQSVSILSTLKDLQELDLSGSEISKKGFETLKAKLPKTKILWD